MYFNAFVKYISRLCLGIYSTLLKEIKAIDVKNTQDQGKIRKTDYKRAQAVALMTYLSLNARYTRTAERARTGKKGDRKNKWRRDAADAPRYEIPMPDVIIFQIDIMGCIPDLSEFLYNIDVKPITLLFPSFIYSAFFCFVIVVKDNVSFFLTKSFDFI